MCRGVLDRTRTKTGVDVSVEEEERTELFGSGYPVGETKRSYRSTKGGRGDSNDQPPMDGVTSSQWGLLHDSSSVGFVTKIVGSRTQV